MRSKHPSRRVKIVETGKEFISVTAAADHLGIDFYTLDRYLRFNKKRQSPAKYIYMDDALYYPDNEERWRKAILGVMETLHGNNQKVTVLALSLALGCSERAIYRNIPNDIKIRKEILNLNLCIA